MLGFNATKTFATRNPSATRLADSTPLSQRHSEVSVPEGQKPPAASQAFSTREVIALLHRIDSIPKDGVVTRDELENFIRFQSNFQTNNIGRVWGADPHDPDLKLANFLLQNFEGLDGVFKQGGLTAECIKQVAGSFGDPLVISAEKVEHFLAGKQPPLMWQMAYMPQFIKK